MTAMKISLITPTRGRAEQLPRFWYSALDHSADPDNVEVSFYVDDDDGESQVAINDLEGNWRLRVGERTITSIAWNEAWKNSTGEIFMMAADDLIFRSKGWDYVIRNKFLQIPDRIVLVFGKDGFAKHDGGLATHGFVHKNWTDTVGTFCPPYFYHSKNDSWVTGVANKLGRLRFIPELLFEHMHPGFKKAPWDKTYAENKKRGSKSKFKEIWSRTAEERGEHVQKLREFINESSVR